VAIVVFFYKMILYLTSERRASLPYWRASVSADRDSHRGARAQDLVPRTQLPLRQAEALGGVSAPQRLEPRAARQAAAAREGEQLPLRGPLVSDPPRVMQPREAVELRRVHVDLAPA